MKQKNLPSEPITKQELDNRFENLVNALRNELRLSATQITEEIHKQFSQIKDEFYTLIDPVIKDIETRREERELGTYQVSDLRKQVTTHEKRISKLEQKVA